MTIDYVVSFFQEAISVALLLSLPALLLGLTVGLTVSVFQAVTQIQEQTLALIPKILAIIGALLVFGGWMLGEMITFTTAIFQKIAHLPG
ncbi:flagellar biosynthesis protein FliQ [Myxococcota bacterium]|nr:flagellar biosynthesis protein FliQ [Myxococcota bacterium]MBU1429361.1 flagellar biosynthesis protein FliQ [Myxococcota bacterium]MBU1899888.1 flagellar biosynthesis protein FliQ [Myxococcota bacterium]